MNKIALRNVDDKGLKTFDRITTYPYGTNAFKVCESQMLAKKKKKQFPYITNHQKICCKVLEGIVTAKITINTLIEYM